LLTINADEPDLTVFNLIIDAILFALTAADKWLFTCRLNG